MKRTKCTLLAFMALTIFIDFAGFGIVLPLLPFWAERLGAAPVGVGLVLTMYALAQFLFTPVLGTLSDRYGRRPVILASLVIQALAFARSALAGSLPILLAARFIGGLGASNIGSAQAVVSDVTPVEKRALTVFPLFTQHSFGWTARQNGYMFTYTGIVNVLMQGGMIGRLVRHSGERGLLIAGLVMLAAGLALPSWSANMALLPVALGIVSLSDGAVTPRSSHLPGPRCSR